MTSDIPVPGYRGPKVGPAGFPVVPSGPGPGVPATDWRAALDVVSQAIAELRLALAIGRDNRLTDQEEIAMLEVYQEFGR